MKRRNIVKIFSILLIILSLSYFTYSSYKTINLKKIQTEEINIFFKNYNNSGNKVNHEVSEYLMVLEIPKLNLKYGVYDIYDERNNINLNVTILKESILPDKENSLILLAAHSGNSLVSYFKNLYNLKYNDKIYIYYEKEKYTYEVDNIYIQSKSLDFSLPKTTNKKLILITCMNNSEYLIIEARQK